MSYPAYRVSLSVDGEPSHVNVALNWQQCVDHFFAFAQEGRRVTFDIVPTQVDFIGVTP